MNKERLEKFFAEVAQQYETYEDIKEHIRESHSVNKLTDDDYNYILQEWDNILKKYNL